MGFGCGCVFAICVYVWWLCLLNLLCIGGVWIAVFGFCIGGINSVAYDYFYWLCLLVLWLFTYCLI